MTLALALLCLAQVSPTPAAEPIPLADAARAFREAEDAALADDGKLWGHSLVTPILFADPSTRAVVANQPDEKEQLQEREGVFVGTLPPEVGIANTATEWAGVRWTMVMWPLPANRYARTRLLLHECFHRIQPELHHGGGDRICEHLDTEAGRTWLRLEFRALAEALVRRDAEREAAIGAALLFRAQRHALFPGSAAKEATFERNEGLAEYTGLRLCGLPAGDLAAQAAQKLRQDETSATFVRSFAYATGPAYGLLLDERGVEWRAKLGPESDLAEWLAKAASWKTPSDLPGEAQKAAARFAGDEVARAEKKRAAEKAERDARHRARFVDGPVLEVPLGAKLSYSFDFNQIQPLAGAGNVYGVVRIVDAWGILDASAGGALLATNANGSPSSARVPAPADLSPPDQAARPIAGDGWTLTLEPGWTLAPGERKGDWRVVRAH